MQDHLLFPRLSHIMCYRSAPRRLTLKLLDKSGHLQRRKSSIHYLDANVTDIHHCSLRFQPSTISESSCIITLPEATRTVP